MFCVCYIVVGPKPGVYRKLPLYFTWGNDMVCVHSTFPISHYVGYTGYVLVVVIVYFLGDKFKRIIARIYDFTTLLINDCVMIVSIFKTNLKITK